MESEYFIRIKIKDNKSLDVFVPELGKFIKKFKGIEIDMVASYDEAKKLALKGRYL